MSDTHNELSQQPITGGTPEEWLGSPDAVQSFRATLDRALERLAVEVAAVRAERDGLRLQLEGVRTELELARAELAERERFTGAVRELREIVQRLNVPVEWLIEPAATPAPPIPVTPAPVAPQQARPEPRPEPEPVTVVPRQRVRRHRGWIKTALARIGVVLAALIVLGVLVISLGPQVAPFETYFVRSGSMEPTFKSGDLIVLTKVDASDVKAGDIITFERPDKPDSLVTHRVVAVETSNAGTQFQTKGDANSAPDAWRVPATGTQWRYKFRIPRIGTVFRYLSTTPARIALVAIPVVALAGISLVDRRKRKRQPASA
jgi:signal peptidase